MPKFKVGDHLIFRQLDISDMGIRYSAVAVTVKTVRKQGTLRIKQRYSWVREPQPPLELDSWLPTAAVGSIHRSTHPDRICVWCFTHPTKDASDIKKRMASRLYDTLASQIDFIERKKDVVASWGHTVQRPSVEFAEMKSVIEEHYT